MSLVIAIARFLQEPTAEETFRKIEESIGRAKTLSVRFQLEARSSARKLQSCSGTLLAKDAGRMNFDMRAQLGELKLDRLVVGDGSRLFVDYGQAGQRREEVPKRLRSDLNAMLSRSGFFIDCFGGGFPLAEGSKAPKEVYLPSDLKREKDDQGAETLTYKLKVAGGLVEDPWSVRLWYDSHLKPTKRSLAIRFRGVDTVIMETYTGFTIDSDISDEKFKLPAGK